MSKSLTTVYARSGHRRHVVIADARSKRGRRRSRRCSVEPLEQRRLLTVEVCGISSLPPEVFSDPAVLESQPQGGGANGNNVSSSGANVDVLANDKAKLNIMTPATQAKRANGEVIEGLMVQPLITTYIQEHAQTGGHDAYAAVSLDDGETWKRFNISESADKSSFNVDQDGGWGGGGGCDDTDHDHNGDDTNSCHSVPAPDPDGDPFAGDPTHSGGGGRFCTDAGDVCGDVTKPMLMVKGRNILMAWTSKYAPKADPMNIGDGPDLFLNKGAQRSVTYDPVEYPELGRVPFSAVWVARGTIKPNGTAIWMEPEQITSGRRDALQVAIAGAGQAGFALVWQEDPAGLRPGHGYGPGDGMSGATVNHKTDIWYSHINWEDFDKYEHKDPPPENPEGQGKNFASVPFSVPVRITDNRGVKVEKLISGKAPKIYYDVCAQDEDGNWLADEDGKAIAKPEHGGAVLKGNSGASRPQIFMQPIKTGGVVTGAEVMIGYEETKGLGLGPPDDHDHGDGTVTVDTTTESDDTGNHPEDIGKYVMYHHFPDFTNPKVVQHGDILNVAADTDGDGVGDDYENARRVRFIVQPKGQAGESGTVMVALYRQGKEGKGKAADIFMRRAVGGYAFENFQEGALNVSSVTPTSFEMNAADLTQDVVTWDWNPENLADQSSDNPFDDARAHRGQLKGDMLLLGYTYTPTWHSPDHSHTTYDFFVRRSFDGGQSLTDVHGNPEPPRNVSNVPPSRSVYEPRLMATPNTISKSNGDPTGDPEDVRNQYVFFVTYGTEDISGPHNMPTHPKDIFYARSTDLGETYETVFNTQTNEREWDKLARGGDQTGSEGAQIRMTPAGNGLYATWLRKQLDVNGNATGSDIFFRKVEYPMVLVEGPDMGVRNQPLDFHFSVDKPGNYEYRIDWNGDGEIDQTKNGTEAGIDVTHIYTEVGRNTVRVYAQCLDEVDGQLVHPQPGFMYQGVTTEVIGVWDDTLFVGGDTGDDQIHISVKDVATVRLNGEQHDFAAPLQLKAFGGDGDDNLQVEGSVSIPVWLYGQGGDDRLKGGGGNDVLIGGPGDDLILGNTGLDLIIGGQGLDRLVGNGDDDILIASEVVDRRTEVLEKIMARWTDDLLAAADRRAGILAAGLLSVRDDGVADILTGSAGEDWFVFNEDDDRATDLKDEAFGTDLDWLLF